LNSSFVDENLEYALEEEFQTIFGDPAIGFSKKNRYGKPSKKSNTE
jgi:hypothetical protein